MKRVMVLFLAVLVCLILFGASPAAAYRFGDQPLADVTTAANQYAQTISMNPTVFRNIMLAITYPEVADNGPDNPPSPMTLSRGDWLQKLYYNNRTAPTYERAFFNPGVGIFQLDSAGFASNLAADSYINTLSASNAVASQIAATWNGCGSCTTDAQRRAYVWKDWYGCESFDAAKWANESKNGIPHGPMVNYLFVNNKCETHFNALATAVFSPSYSMSSWGGAIRGTCFNMFTDVSFTCTKVNPAIAQGYTDSWYYTLEGGGPGISSPVSETFVVYKGTDGYEYRIWLKEDNTFGGSGLDLYDYRPSGADARSTLYYGSGRFLCFNNRCQ